MNRFLKIILTIVILIVFVIMISLIASSLVRPNQITPIRKIFPSVEKSEPLDTNYTTAVWIWQSPGEIQNNLDPMVEFAQEEGINSFYVYIDEYIDIYEMPEGSEKQQKMQDYLNNIKNILTKAQDKNIKVHALSGNTNYSYDSHSYIPLILINHIFEYNKASPNLKFAGIQFDIEFYDNPKFFDNPEENIASFIKLVSDTANLTKSLNDQNKENVRLGYVIPFWFDKPKDYFEKPILKDVINAISVAQNPYLVIMSYRNVVYGNDGSLEVSQDELEQANNTPVKIIIAQELVENKDSKITHFGKSRKEIKDDLTKIIEGAKPYPNFEGISLHEINAFMNTN